MLVQVLAKTFLLIISMEHYHLRYSQITSYRDIGPIWLQYEGKCYGKFMLHVALTHNKYIRDVETKMHLNKK